MQIPRHIAIIMDGNRRWAKEKGLKPSEGHKAGVDALERIVKESVKLGLDYLTVYALSTENLKNRDKLELGDLFTLLRQGFVEKLPILKKEGVRVSFIGEPEKLPAPARQALKKTESILSNEKNLNLIIALNYGSRAEIVRAARGVQSDQEVTEVTFEKNLYTHSVPDPELIIRTGGEKRLSNFLLWQAAYSELYFTDQLWPDFDEKSLKQAINDYNLRKRNFGV